MTLPTLFEDLQVYVPEFEGDRLLTVNILSMVSALNDCDAIMYLLDAFIITSLKNQLIVGIGSPTDRHKYTIVSLLFSVSLLIGVSMLGVTKEQNIN